MNIPDHLVDLVRELAEAHAERLCGDASLIEVHLPPSHPNVGEAQRRLDLAFELLAHFPPTGRAVA